MWNQLSHASWHRLLNLSEMRFDGLEVALVSKLVVMSNHKDDVLHRQCK